jgi:hypothetical protein
LISHRWIQVIQRPMRRRTDQSHPRRFIASRRGFCSRFRARDLLPPGSSVGQPTATLVVAAVAKLVDEADAGSAQNGTKLHQNSQTPGSGSFLPNFLPKQGSAAESRCYISWSQPRTGVADPSLLLTFQAGHADLIPPSPAAQGLYVTDVSRAGGRVGAGSPSTPTASGPGAAQRK